MGWAAASDTENTDKKELGGGAGGGGGGERERRREEGGTGWQEGGGAHSKAVQHGLGVWNSTHPCRILAVIISEQHPHCVCLRGVSGGEHMACLSAQSHTSNTFSALHCSPLADLSR